MVKLLGTIKDQEEEIESETKRNEASITSNMKKGERGKRKKSRSRRRRRLGLEWGWGPATVASSIGYLHCYIGLADSPGRILGRF